jgi:type II secretory pathway pseudopilin PulG
MKCKSKATTNRRRSISGFTLLEAMIAVLLLTIVVGAIFSQINRAQRNMRVEGQKLDLTQQQGEFLDQFTRDLHQAGFPTLKSVGSNPALAAAGLTNITSTSLTMEGDLDGTGNIFSTNVKVVTYSYCDGVVVACPAGVACPCLLRSSAKKGKPPGVPFVAVQNVLPPGAAGIFTPYDSGGNQLFFPVTPQNVRSVRITFTLAGGQDANGVTQIQTTMTGMARLPNN